MHNAYALKYISLEVKDRSEQCMVRTIVTDGMIACSNRLANSKYE